MESGQPINIKLEKIDDIKDFVDIANKYSFNITLASGKYEVDAKSVIEIFSLDLEEPIKLTAHTSENIDLIERIKKYIVN